VKLIGGLVAKELNEAIEELGKEIEKDKKVFAEKLKNLATKIYSFAFNIIDKMFSFVDDIQKLAQSKNWNLSELTIEIPSAGFTITNVFGIPIPIPEFKTPSISITFQPKK
jgi:hypothetical protein